MKRLARTAAIVLALSIPTLAGEIPIGGKAEPTPTPTAQSTNTNTTTSSITTAIILTILSLIG